jgi:multidrug efflux pump subunit AcrA (membrane-fusion protein)
MTAEVEIIATDLDNVLTVPHESVVRSDGKDRVALLKSEGGFEWREVTLGATNETSVEVKQGIRSGDRLAVDPRDLMTEQQKRAGLKVPAAPPPP